MTYIAKLVTVSAFKNLTDKYKPFVYYHSSLEDIEVDDDDKIALLQIEGTESYFPIFLKTKPTIEQIEEKMSKLKTQLNSETKNLLIKYFSEQ